METSTRLQLPYIMPSQAQKHVTHNESIDLLDTVVQLAVAGRQLGAPPADPAEGDCRIVAAPALGAFAGREQAVARFLGGAWRFLEPRPGWIAWVEDEAQLVLWNGTAWATLAATLSALQDLQRLGLGATADAANPFAARLNAALWTARGAGEGGTGDLRVTLNKETAADVVSLILQSGYSGRAELGLSGSDDLTLKVSPDGAAWTTALSIDRTTGQASLPNAAISGGTVGGYPVADLPAALGTARRNAFINPVFDVAQAYSGPFALASGPTPVDMVRGAPAGGGAWTVSLENFSAGQTDVPGNPRRFLRVVQTAAPASGYAGLWFILGPVDTLAGEVVTVSFYARVQSGSLAIGRGLMQNFGSGGSATSFNASSAIPANATLSVSWQWFTATTVTTGIVGKTVGAGNFLALRLLAATNGGSFHGDFCGIKVEPGAAATQLDPLSRPETELLCRRYFERVAVQALNGALWVPCLPKRAVPAVSADVGTPSHATANGCRLTHGADAACVVTFDARLS